MLAGDWDLDGDDSVGIYRPSDGHFYLTNENLLSVADLIIPFGAPNWIPTTGNLSVS